MTTTTSTLDLFKKLEGLYIALAQSTLDPIKRAPKYGITAMAKEYGMSIWAKEGSDNGKVDIGERIRASPQDLEYAIRFHRREVELFDLIEEENNRGNRERAADCMRKLCQNVRNYISFVDLHQAVLQESFLGYPSYELENVYLDYAVSFNPAGTKEQAISAIDEMEAEIEAYRNSSGMGQIKIASANMGMYRKDAESLERKLGEYGLRI